MLSLCDETHVNIVETFNSIFQYLKDLLTVDNVYVE